MTDYTKRVRSYLVSVDDELKRVLSRIDEEDLFVEALKEELRRLDESEAASVDKAGDEILFALEGSRREKIAGAKSDLDDAARELARRWEAAERTNESLKSQNQARDAQLDRLRTELANLKRARERGREAFSRNLDSALKRVSAGANEEEEAWRRESARRVGRSILAYKKRPESQTPISELLPIDKSVSRIYQQMSYLIEGKQG